MRRFSWMSLLAGVVIFILGAGMRVYAAATLAATQARLIAARPASAKSSRLDSQPVALQPANAAPDAVYLPANNLWNSLEPVSDAVNGPDGQLVWQVKDAGWHIPSGWPGWDSNVVVAGHSPSQDKDVWSRSVFRQLAYLTPGDEVDLAAGRLRYRYRVGQVFAIPASEANTVNAAEWLAPGLGERLTLVTCWPPNTAAYRILVIAYPMNSEMLR